MAHAVDFKGSNQTFAGNGGDVGDLRVFMNGACVVSMWEFTDEEIAEIVRTRRATVSTFSGAILFPIFVGSESVTRSVVADHGKVW